MFATMYTGQKNVRTCNWQILDLTINTSIALKYRITNSKFTVSRTIYIIMYNTAFQTTRLDLLTLK